MLMCFVELFLGHFEFSHELKREWAHSAFARTSSVKL